MFLIDTNVISEARKGKKANPGVINFFRSIEDESSLYLAVQTIGEIRRGVENIRSRGDHVQARQLESWLNKITDDYSDRLLEFDVDCAQVWGKLMSPSNQHPIDRQIASIALIHDMTVVTRNVADYSGCGVKIVNPFV